MAAVLAAVVAVDVLGAFTILLLLALAGFSLRGALAWIWDATIHPVENFRKMKRGDPL